MIIKLKRLKIFPILHYFDTTAINPCNHSHCSMLFPQTYKKRCAKKTDLYFPQKSEKLTVQRYVTNLIRVQKFSPKRELFDERIKIDDERIKIDDERKNPKEAPLPPNVTKIK